MFIVADLNAASSNAAFASFRGVLEVEVAIVPRVRLPLAAD
jgi:hypothetical protein